MIYNCGSNIDLSDFLRHNVVSAQNVLFGRFVPKENIAGNLLLFYAKGLRTLRFSFTDTNLTHFGGMVLLQRFCNELRLRWLIQKYVRVDQRNADYLPSDLILSLLYAIMAGLRRINKTEILQYNGVFLSLIGIPKFPDQSTLRRFLKRLPPKTIRQFVALHDQPRASLFGLPKHDSL